MININLDKIIFALLCLYAVLIPFELILEVFFGIETIFKPYRVVCLGLIGVYTLKQVTQSGFSFSNDLKQDIFLYLVFIYGLFISFVQMIISEFSLGKFYNELFQTSLYLVIFIIVKNMALSQRQLYQLFQSLILGICINALYVFNNFYVAGNLGRQAGFMDNPNYLSLSTIIALAFVVLNFQKISIRYKVGSIALLFILFSTFLISGSRTGLFVLIAVTLIVFTFLSIQQKLIISALVILSLVALQFTGGIFNLSSDSVLNSRLEDREFSEDPRFPIWTGIIRASQETHFVGLGLGQFEARFPDFYQGENNEAIYEMLNYGYYLSPHSDYFAVLITYGIIGLILFIFFFYHSLKKILLHIRFAPSKAHSISYQLQLVGLVTVMLFGIAAENFVSPLYWMILTLSTKSISHSSGGFPS